MAVKTPDRRSQRSGDETRAALLDAAREQFGEKGYGATLTEDVVAQAGVTKGALYHHFGGKSELFAEVYEQVKREISDRVAEVFMGRDPWTALVDGCRRLVDAQLDPAVRRIVLNDARAVLGWEEVRRIETQHGGTALRGALRKAMVAGVIDRQPLRPLSLMLTGALSESVFYVAEADDALAARAEVDALVQRILDGLRPSSDQIFSTGA
ncbi:MAG TPA: TetR/AcrR family transcriptional regulator [Mycobacteriales bacterium]|nr:TetR/AcrR family transcriptional regulator [Mycobacteriales bacterium]